MSTTKPTAINHGHIENKVADLLNLCELAQIPILIAYGRTGDVIGIRCVAPECEPTEATKAIGAIYAAVVAPAAKSGTTTPIPA